MLVHRGRSCGGDGRRTTERVPRVFEQELGALDVLTIRAALLNRVLDLEEVGEVGSSVEAQPHVDRRAVVVQDGQLFTEAVPHLPATDHRELGVDVYGPRPLDEEEARLK